ncbi:MAG: hypothetical protein ACPGJJ_05160, partial [Parvibaculales bacterium]
MDPLNLILLIIVMLIGWRLRSVLGTRNDDEKPSRRTDAYRLNRDAYENPPEQAKSSALAQEAMGSDEASDEAVDQAATESATESLRIGRGLAFFNDIDPH